MSNRLSLALLAVLVAPSVASAQTFYVPPPRVVVAPPPRVVVAPPPVYVAPPPPHVYLRDRVRWHLQRAGVVVAPPRVAVAPPVVYVQPAPRVYVQPAPRVYVQPTYVPRPAAPVVVVRQAPPVGWRARVGLGVRGSGLASGDDWHSLGIGGELLLRAGNHVVLELGAAYEKNAQGTIDRVDIPVTFGARFHIGRPTWIVSPYFVAAAGMDFAHQDLKFMKDEAYFFNGQLGGGLEVRLGQHVALTADVRFDGKARLDDPSPRVLAAKSVNSQIVRPLENSAGAQFRLGAAVYF